MTTIRKIVTSKIDGNNANNTSTNEIRPFGELAVYINTDNPNDPNKLELLMFDGVRTHLRSKVLAKGTFYGGDADSADQGDGIENLDTIKLIPDAELHYNDGDYDNDQYIVIDPTLPNHIHVRAGGAIDSSTATLFLGGEENNVMVSDSDDQVAISTNDTHTWLFGTSGNLTVPANSSILTNETALKIATHSTTTYTFNQAYWEALNGNATRMLTITGNAQYFSCTVTANQDGTYTVAGLTGNSFEPGDWFKVPGNELGGVTPANDIQINIATVDGEGVILTTTITGTAVGKQWQFGTDGTTTLPQGGTISEVTVTPFVGGNPSVGILLTPFVSDEFGTPNPDMAVKIYPTFNDDDHIHIVAGNPGTVDLFLGDDIQYVKLEQDGGNVVISADDPVGIKWTFDVNGRLTLPKNSSVREVTPATGAAAHVIVIQSASSILNTSFASLPPAPISNYVVPGTDIVVNVTWSTNGENYHAPAFVVVDGGSGHTGGGESGGGDVLTVPYADMGISGGGNWTWYVVDIASDVVLAAGLESWQFAGDGTTTFPGAVVKSTVAKTGVILPTTTGVVNGLTHDSVLTGLTDNTYGPFTLSGVTFSVFVFGGVINSAQSISSTGTATVNDVLGTIDSGVIGGTAGTTITWTVDTVVQETPTALDLTKSINKLTSGFYTLADGVEGQIMYLVPQNGITVAGNVGVSVANFRTSDFTGAGGALLPFRIYNGVGVIDSTGLCTLIFTDSAWQQTGGAWD